MKIHATYEEICQMLSRLTGEKVTSFVVTKAPKLPTFADELSAAIKPFDYLGREKIVAIKAIRAVVDARLPKVVRDGYQVCALGLSDSKWAIENWDKFISFVKRNNRLPLSGFAVVGYLQ